jgi:endonuclease YncB( thermonuclease family)
LRPTAAPAFRWLRLKSEHRDGRVPKAAAQAIRKVADLDWKLVQYPLPAINHYRLWGIDAPEMQHTCDNDGGRH